MANDFHAERLTGIGSSDAAPSLGLSPYKTPLELYAEKIGEGRAVLDTPEMAWGRRLERTILDHYQMETGRGTELAPPLMRHPNGFMIAHLDARGEDRVIEAKTARNDRGWGEPGTDQIPQAYLLQVTHQMIVSGLSLADIAVLIGGSDFRIYPIRLDPELAELVIAGEREFWRRVQERDPPEPTTLAEAQLRWRQSKEQSVELPSNVADAYRRLVEVRAQVKTLEEEGDKYEMTVKQWMGEAAIATVDGIEAATWRTSKPSQVFDSKRFKEECGPLYAEYTIEKAGTRRFLLKG
jgi:putative phage-type endonuclease